MKAAQSNISSAQEKQKLHADKRRFVEPFFDVGTRVLLSTKLTKHIQLKNPGARKLFLLCIGPFEVTEQVGAIAYKLKLPAGLSMHDVLHVSLLKEHRDDGTVIPPPPPENFADYPEYEVEQIVSYDAKRKKVSCEVAWVWT